MWTLVLVGALSLTTLNLVKCSFDILIGFSNCEPKFTDFDKLVASCRSSKKGKW